MGIFEDAVDKLPVIKNYDDDEVQVMVHKPEGFITIFTFTKIKSHGDLKKWAFDSYIKYKKLDKPENQKEEKKE